ncbi:uncharacterized protein BYT42DRAFT_13539 [Radiomyces spectabilis]|uniref:uncharacterized protein n=1 Tax=Radiomyces spectabilis TaxID=64574 RepID=UPI0022206DA4|nr:uncharacterized protein BYT42DRAFT_13539 [Radiomyces spectabilis]KAI8393626.1 hypothetical protein BYT42DRAFT_13539 [Radiomyces spectabilis]
MIHYLNLICQKKKLVWTEESADALPRKKRCDAAFCGPGTKLLKCNHEQRIMQTEYGLNQESL